MNLVHTEGRFEQAKKNNTREVLGLRTLENGEEKKVNLTKSIEQRKPQGRYPIKHQSLKTLVTVPAPDFATTIINNQQDQVERLLVPQGLSMFSSPSLPPYLGSLSIDLAEPNNLLIGNGSAWERIQGGLPVLLPTVNFTSDISGAITASSAFTVNASPISTSIVAVTIKSSLVANCSATATINLNTVLPSGYRPSQTMVSFCSIYVNTGYVPCTFSVSTLGAMILAKEDGVTFANTDTGLVLLNYTLVYMTV